MKKLLVTSALLTTIIFLSCGDSAVSIMDTDGGNTFSARYDDPGHAEMCHDNMRDLSTAIFMFHGMTSRFPDDLSELEMVDPSLCTLTCPSCDLLYMYDLSSSGEVWTVTCPLPVDPNHGYIENGHTNWPPDPYEWPSICHGNMTSLAVGCSIFYGTYSRFPDELSELGTSGIMEDWDRQCPACGELYHYSTDSTGTTYMIHCPLPWDPGHGYVIDGECSWPPDTSGFQDACRGNMRCLGTGCSIFYGTYARFPNDLSELGTSGIMENWDVPCPACGEIYHYSTDPTGQTYFIQCPLPWDPGHGIIVDGYASW